MEIAIIAYLASLAVYSIVIYRTRPKRITVYDLVSVTLVGLIPVINLVVIIAAVLDAYGDTVIWEEKS